jgi:cytochrome c6
MTMNARHVSSIAIVLLLVAAASPPLFADDAAQTYKTRCNVCHGPDGSGDTPMGKKTGARALGSDEVQKQTDDELRKSIVDGKGKMPAYGGKLSAEQIGGLVKLIRTMAAN